MIRLGCALTLALGAAGADTPVARQPDEGDGYVSVMQEVSGEPILVIRYPWTRHAQPSIEVRALEPDEVGSRLVRPLGFKRHVMRGGVTVAVHQCHDRSEGVAQTATFVHDDVRYEIFGSRNALGRPSVCVVSRKQRPRPPADLLAEQAAPQVERASPTVEQARPKTEPARVEKPRPEIRAAFPLLDDWALDERTLYLELPAAYFADPTLIRVWLLRGDAVVWTATTAWPGRSRGTSDE